MSTAERPMTTARADAAVRTGWPRVAAATFRRDARTAMSYRAGFLLGIGGAVLNLLSVLFLSDAVGAGAAESVAPYGGDYFGFAVVGIAFSAFMAVGLTSISSRIREGQTMGTLELMLLSPNRLGLLLASSSLWGHFQALITLVVYLVAATALGMDVSRANVPVAILSLVLATAAFNALGLIAASFIIVLKQGNPVSLVIGTASALLGGVLFPVSVLPDWLRALGSVLPLTHALELLRRSVLVGEGLDTLLVPFLALSALTAILLPIGLWACRYAVRIAQTDGSLSQY